MSLQHSYQALAEQESIDIPTGWLQGRTIYGGLVSRFNDAKSIVELLPMTRSIYSVVA